MADSIESSILSNINNSRRGTIFFAENFLHAGNAKAVNKALERLVNKDLIARIATGIYVRPRQSKLLGPVVPGTEEIAKAIANRDKARIVPAGAYALNKLGLSTQVPLNVVYLTDGAARKIKIGNRSILFKKASPKNLSAQGPISGLAIQALKALGSENLTSVDEKKILKVLSKEKKANIENDMMLAPEWIRKIMRKSLIYG